MPSISASELRKHFSPERRKPIDYLDLAIHLAKDHAARLTAAETGVQTHWQVWDAPIYRGTQQAACGEIASLKVFSAVPTCPACRQALARYEAMEF
jgi:hypothetical protein